MDFFDKLKAGVAEAGSKAKTVVEVNRLKMQNNTLQGQIDQQYQEMGKRVFEAAQGAIGLSERKRSRKIWNGFLS